MLSEVTKGEFFGIVQKLNMNTFDGKKIRDEILVDLSKKVAKMERKPTLAVFLIGSDPVSAKYDDIKKKFTEKIGAHFCLYKFEEKESEDSILEAIEYLNNDSETDGIMIQIPVPAKYDRNKMIEKISPKKDVDGLRYCAGLKSSFKPPVILAILEAMKRAETRNKEQGTRELKITIIGHGFLVGSPLLRALQEKNIKPTVISDCVGEKENFCIFDSEVGRENLAKADIVIAATGCAGLIKAETVKDGVVLIDAGTSEENGQLCGDIDPNVYKKASYYTPVPGGIGPVTVVMLLQNLVSTHDSKK